MKAYVKPELFVESYELSQHIATCGIDMSNHTDSSICTAQLDPYFWNGLTDTVFNNGQDGCSMDIGVIDIYCYTVGVNEAGKLFNS